MGKCDCAEYFCKNFKIDLGEVGKLQMKLYDLRSISEIFMKNILHNLIFQVILVLKKDLNNHLSWKHGIISQKRNGNCYLVG